METNRTTVWKKWPTEGNTTYVWPKRSSSSSSSFIMPATQVIENCLLYSSNKNYTKNPG